MAELNNPIPLEIIEDGTTVQLDFTSDLYKRVQRLIFKGLPFKDTKHFLEVTKQVQTGDFKTDPLAYHLYTLLYISNLFEEAAKTQGKITKKIYDPATKEIKAI